MQIFSPLPRKLYQFVKCYVYKYSQTNPILHERLALIQKWEPLKRKNVDDKTIAQTLNVSRATYYRLKKALKQRGTLGLKPKSRRPHTFRRSKITQALKDKVLELRRENITYSKFKIYHIIKRDFEFKTSESTVGRILKSFMKRGIVSKSNAYRFKPKARVFNHHAKRWQYGMKSQKPGMLLQIDHMTVYSTEGVTFKHFQATDPITRCIVCEAFREATSFCAKKFLDKIIKELPFDLISIQVDGGSEFRQHFEASCKEKTIPLFVLPPRKPQYNGSVERNNGILKEEFYQIFDIPSSLTALRPMLDQFVYKYNTYRPQQFPLPPKIPINRAFKINIS